MLGGRSFCELYAQFEAAHRNETNKTLHLFGIPTLAISGLLWLAAPFVDKLWMVSAVLMPIGFACQFRGHVIEGNRPEVFSDWRFFFVGFVWWVALARDRLRRPSPPSAP